MKYLKFVLLISFLNAFVICEGGIFNAGSPARQQTKKEYLLRVDPQNIIRLICKHAGMVLPEYVTRDLEVVSSVCKCDETSLDLFNKKLRVRNFKVVMPLKKNGNHHGGSNENFTALSVGTFCVTWDSYLHPCIEIEVEDVDILVEFINLILTKNNWNELADRGFPPNFYDNDDASTTASTTESTFLRIGSIRMVGEIRLKIRSRPLDKDLVEDIVFDLGKLEEMNNQIRSASQRAKEKTGRRGLKTEELYEIINVYFNRQIQQLVKIAAADLALGAFSRDSGGKTVKDAKKLLSGAMGVAMKYSKDVGKKADENFESNLKNLGMGPRELNMAKDLFKSSAASLFGKPHDIDADEFSDVYVVDMDDKATE